MKGILESFVSGTSVTINGNDTNTEISSFTVNTHFTTNGNLIGVFTGHGHVDRHVSINGVNYVQNTCGYIDVTQSDVYPSERLPMTYNEISFDVVNIKTSARKVIMKRFGYGNDREYTY